MKRKKYSKKDHSQMKKLKNLKMITLMILNKKIMN
jgi:hypothetical protein